MDLDVFGACQTRQMYESKPPQREAAFGYLHRACFRAFDQFDKLQRHQDPSKCIKIHANPSICLALALALALPLADGPFFKPGMARRRPAG